MPHNAVVVMRTMASAGCWIVGSVGYPPESLGKPVPLGSGVVSDGVVGDGEPEDDELPLVVALVEPDELLLDRDGDRVDRADGSVVAVGAGVDGAVVLVGGGAAGEFAALGGRVRAYSR